LRKKLAAMIVKKERKENRAVAVAAASKSNVAV
jgi:hypothetical protein